MKTKTYQSLRELIDHCCQQVTWIRKKDAKTDQEREAIKKETQKQRSVFLKSVGTEKLDDPVTITFSEEGDPEMNRIEAEFAAIEDAIRENAKRNAEQITQNLRRKQGHPKLN